MAKADYYETLGINQSATEDEIKSAFRKAAKTYHPDLHPGDAEAEAKFKEINEAYEVLSDPDKRAKYDRYGHAAFDAASGGGGYNSSGGFTDFSDIFDIFSGFGGFGGGSGAQRNGPSRGNDLKYTITISFDEAAFGARKEITVPREEVCDTCSGSGAKPGTQPTQCPNCGGSGQTRVQQNTVFGAFSTVRTCDKCNGTGQLISDPCPDCRGRGRVRRNKRIIVNIPAGIDNGQSISMRGDGEAGYKGGPSGDLYITVQVKPHKLFTRKGYDIYSEMSIPMTTAVLGGEIQVPTLSGSVKYNVPEGTQPQTRIRLRDQGVQRLNSSGKGDMYVRINVQIPTKINDSQRVLVSQLAESMGEKPADAKPIKKNIFGKSKA